MSVLLLANCATAGLPGFGAEIGKKSSPMGDVRVPYTDVVNYFGYVEPGAAPDSETKAGSVHAGLNEMVNMMLDIPLFSGIDRSKLKLLVFTSERVNFEPDQVIFRQGDTGDKAYVVIEGEVDVVLESEHGEKIVASLGANEIFGEMALLSKMPRTTTIRARTPVVLLSLSQDVFLRMVEENSEIAVAMMRVLAERLASTLRKYGMLMAEHQEAEDDDVANQQQNRS